MSAAALAEYLILRPDQQEKILHDSRFASSNITAAYRGALDPIRAFCTDIRRDKSTLQTAKNFLKGRSTDQSFRPKAREEALRCIETIDLFSRAENAFGLGPLDLTNAPRFNPMMLSGVALSVQPDLLIKRQDKVGAMMFRPQKAPDPEACRLEETKRQRGEHRREMARYMLAMVQMLFEGPAENVGAFSRELSFIADIRMGERIDFSTSDHAARVRAVKAACRQIATLWGDIEPRKSVLAKGD